jgi:hypothetical protein
LGSPFPLLRCTHCNSTALFDYDVSHPDGWRICYRRVNRAPRYYYVSIYLGRAGWLSARKALTISTNGYAQRKRVVQAKAGDLTWLHPDFLSPPLPPMGTAEKVYLSLKAVTLQEIPPPGIFARFGQETLLDSGKLYITDQKLYLLGQRRDWSHVVDDISQIDYNEKFWFIYLDVQGQPQRLRGANAADQLDAQLVAAVVETLWRENSG